MFSCFNDNFYVFKNVKMFIIIVGILRFLAVHHFKIIFFVEIYMSMTTCGWGSACAVV